MKDIFHACLLLFIVTTFFLMCDNVLKKNKQLKNKLKNKFIKCILGLGSKCNKINISTFWVITHFILYFILGLICPNRWIFIIITIIIWEVYELIKSIKNNWYNEKVKKIFDVIADISGYYLGMYVLIILKK
jgi:VanZ family protein